MAKALKVRVEALRVEGRAREVAKQRTMMAYVLVRRGGYAVKEVAQYFGRDSTTISSLLSRYEKTMRERGELKRETERLGRFV